MGWVRDVGGLDSRSRRDLEVHVGSGRINGGVVFRISVDMGRASGDYGRNGVSGGTAEPRIIEIRRYGESGRGFVVSAFE